jgi:hypothetical protein
MAEHFAGLARDVLVGVFGNLAREINGAVVDRDFGKTRANMVTNDCNECS